MKRVKKKNSIIEDLKPKGCPEMPKEIICNCTKEKKEKTVKEVAKSFGLSVNQLVMISGYSRQGLYDVIEKNVKKNTNRYNAFLEHLRCLNNCIYEADKSEAKIQFNLRNEMLELLKEQKNDK